MDEKALNLKFLVGKCNRKFAREKFCLIWSLVFPSSRVILLNLNKSTDFYGTGNLAASNYWIDF